MVDPAVEASVLERIVVETRAALPQRKEAKPEALLRKAAAARPAPRDFIAALRRPDWGWWRR